jgi:hypothetical protein
MLFIIACSKDKSNSRKLEGKWKLVKKEVAGIAENIDGLTVVLECGDCISANNGCRGVYREKIALPNNTSSTVLLPIETKFSGNGQILTIDYDYGFEIEVYEVIQITKKTLIIKFQGSENVYQFDAFD